VASQNSVSSNEIPENPINWNAARIKSNWQKPMFRKSAAQPELLHEAII
jgi:hypothetical protein